MTYQDLLEELQNLSSEELQQTVILYYGCDGIEDIQVDDQNSLEEIDSLIAYNQDDQIVLLV